MQMFSSRQYLTTRRQIVGSTLAATALSAIPRLPTAAAITGQPPSALVMMPATELATNIRTRKVSSREVMTAYLDHIDRFNPAVNAIVSLQPRDALLAAADDADAEIGRGDYKGWMHGLPHAVKDLALVKGIRTTFGSPLFETFVAPVDAIFVERLRASGAIFIGKTNAPELGLGSQTYNPVFGTTGNAYDPTKTAGGSSGGASAGLALCMLPVADGSDFGGSLRNPAGWNNVFGFRPSVGLVPLGPTRELFMQSIGYEGPMGRTVTDLAMLLSVMAGYDDRAPLSLTGDPRQFAQPLQRDMKGVRIGWLGNLGSIPMEAGMIELCLTGLKRLEDAGCVIEEANLSIGRDAIWDSFVKLRQGFLAGGLVSFYNDPAKRGKLKPEALWEIEAGLKLSAVDLYSASAQRSAVYQAFRSGLQQHDFLAMPSAQVFPFEATLHWPAEVSGVHMDSYHRWMEIVAGPSLAGLPTVAVPAGFGPGGLPSGIQLIGRGQHDFEVLQLAHVYEQVSKTVLGRLPPLLAA
jgi:amidase